MEPQIKNGSEVLISSIPYLFTKPRAGDIVAFWNFDKVFISGSLKAVLIKRIKKIKQNHYLLEGDNVSDSLRIGWKEKKDIIGKVVFIL